MSVKSQTTLYYREGSSDKIYQIQITEAGNDLYNVDAYYGRRGATLAHAPKTAAGPVPLAAAEKIYNKEIRGKESKGYTADESGTAYVATSKEDRVTGLAPQLLNMISEEEVLRLISDDQWVMQEKFDGVRIMVQYANGEVIGSNRKGLSVAMPETVVKEIKEHLPEDTILDGEMIGDKYYVFDMLRVNGNDLTKHSYGDRFTAWAEHIASSVNSFKYLANAGITYTTEKKQELYQKLLQTGREGVVLKKLSAPYVPGRPNSGGNQLKFKFYATATCLVHVVNYDRRSVGLSVATEDGKGFTSVGNVTIPPNYNVPPQGACIEVRYLYAYRGGSLYQPTYLGERKDKTVPDRVDTLKFKPEDTDEEE